MAEHELKFGDWCENDVKARCRVVAVAKCDGTVKVIHDDGRVSAWRAPSCFTYLPDCDSWTWQPTPKLQLREGAWYERADGKVVGPLRNVTGIARWKWQIGDLAGYWYHEDGRNETDSWSLIREVPAPAPKIEPKYRPFANAAEFKPHRDRWVTNKDGKLLGRVCTYSETDCWFVGVFGEYSGNWERCFKHIVFDDTKLPFGVEVQS